MGCCPAGCQGSQGCLGDAAVHFLVGAASMTSEQGNGIKRLRPVLSTGLLVLQNLFVCLSVLGAGRRG